MTDEEVWRSIPHFPDYEASSLGRIRRGVTRGSNLAGRVLKCSPDRRYGYPKVTLHNDGRLRTCWAHQVICETFHGPAPGPEYEVRHLDGKKINCRSNNVCWGTAKQNAEDRQLHNPDGWAARGEEHHNRVLTAVEVVSARQRHEAGEAIRAMLKDFPVAYVTLCDAVKRRTWSHL